MLFPKIRIEDQNPFSTEGKVMVPSCWIGFCQKVGLLQRESEKTGDGGGI
jgi:hypothetical protein